MDLFNNRCHVGPYYGAIFPAPSGDGPRLSVSLTIDTNRIVHIDCEGLQHFEYATLRAPPQVYGDAGPRIVRRTGFFVSCWTPRKLGMGRCFQPLDGAVLRRALDADPERLVPELQRVDLEAVRDQETGKDADPELRTRVELDALAFQPRALGVELGGAVVAAPHTQKVLLHNVKRHPHPVVLEDDLAIGAPARTVPHGDRGPVLALPSALFRMRFLAPASVERVLQ